jgi:hypothetical protein
MNNNTINQIRDMIQQQNTRSAWLSGVQVYALELLDEYANNYGVNACAPSLRDLLNGADNWNQYSEGGCSLIYDRDIAERLCTASELKRTHHGEKNPNARENWLNVQARALHQAAALILSCAREVSAC